MSGLIHKAHSTNLQICLKLCLSIQNTMELVELVENLGLLVLTNRSLNTGGDSATVVREPGVVKPLDELEQLGGKWNDLVVRNRIEKLAEGSEHEFLINCGSTQVLRFYFFLR